MTMTENEVAQACMSRLKATDSFTSTLQGDRKKAYDLYHAELFGDEVEGQSQFVTTDVRDTIEAVLPQIIEMFVGDENPVEFCAKSEEDVDQARQESEYVRHVYNQKNDGFMTSYSWIKDGLMYRNGVVKSFWDERVDEEQETYEGKSFLEYVAITADPQVDVEEATARIGEEEFSEEEFKLLPLELQAEAVFDFVAVRREDNSQVSIYPVAPENFFIDRDHPELCLDDATMICERITVTESDLITDGYDKKLVQSIPSGNNEQFSEERTNRFAKEGSVTENSVEDGASREVVIHEFYIRLDVDGDGKTELRFIKLAGPSGSIVLDNEVCDSQPYSVWSPVPETHKHYGLSYVDLVKSIQVLRSTVMRGMLDNLYLTNSPAKVVNPDKVFMQDMLETGPGVIYRSKDINAIRSEVTPFMGEASIGVLNKIDEMRHERTGVNPVSQGLDPAALADSTNIVGPMLINQALMRVKMVARVFAETGMKHLMGRIHELCSKHDKQDRLYDVAGTYSTVSPREWSKREEFKIKVGVGHVDRIQRLQAINTFKQNHIIITNNGGLGGALLNNKNVYEVLVEEARLLGYADGAKFYSNPEEYQAPPPKEDPMSEALEIEGAKAVADVQKAAAKNQHDMKRHNDEIELQKLKLAQEKELAEKKLAQEREIAEEKMLYEYGRELTRAGKAGKGSVGQSDLPESNH